MVIPISNSQRGSISPQMASQDVNASIPEIKSDNSMEIISNAVSKAGAVAVNTIQKYESDKDSMLADSIYNNYKKFVDDSLYSQDDDVIKNDDGSVSVQKKGYLFKKGSDAITQNKRFNTSFQDTTDASLGMAISNVKNPELQRKLITSIGDLASRSKLEVAQHADREYTKYTTTQIQAMLESEVKDTVGYDDPKQLKQSFNRISGYTSRLGNINSLPEEVVKNETEKAIAYKLKTVATKRTLADSNKRDGYSAAISMVYSQKGLIPESVINAVAHDLEKEQIQNEFLYSRYGNLSSDDFYSLIESKKSLTQFEKTEFFADYKKQQEMLGKQDVDARTNMMLAPVEARISTSAYPDQITNRLDYIINNFGYVLDPNVSPERLREANLKIKERFDSAGIEDLNWVRGLVKTIGYDDKTRDKLSSFLNKIKNSNTEAAADYQSKVATIETNFANFKLRTQKRINVEDGSISLTTKDWSDMFELSAQIDSLQAIGNIEDKRVIQMKTELSENYFRQAVENSKAGLMSAIGKGKLGKYIWTKLPFTKRATFDENVEAYMDIAQFSSEDKRTFADLISGMSAEAFRQMRDGSLVGVTGIGEKVQLSTNGIPSGPAEEIIPDVMLRVGSRFLRDKDAGGNVENLINYNTLNAKQVNRVRELFFEELSNVMSDRFSLKGIDAVVVGKKVVGLTDSQLSMADYAAKPLNENIVLNSSPVTNIKSWFGKSIPEQRLTVNNVVDGISFIKDPTTRLYKVYSTRDKDLGYKKKPNYTLIEEEK